MMKLQVIFLVASCLLFGSSSALDDGKGGVRQLSSKSAKGKKNSTEKNTKKKSKSKSKSKITTTKSSKGKKGKSDDSSSALGDPITSVFIVEYATVDGMTPADPVLQKVVDGLATTYNTLGSPSTMDTVTVLRVTPILTLGRRRRLQARRGIRVVMEASGRCSPFGCPASARFTTRGRRLLRERKLQGLPSETELLVAYQAFIVEEQFEGVIAATVLEEVA